MADKEPTKKQIRAANMIFEHFGYPKPDEFSTQAYWHYIHDHYAELVKYVKAARERGRRWCDAQQDSVQSQRRQKEQREADWRAVHIHADAWAESILDGAQLPSWFAEEDPAEYRRHLRSLGFQSSAERRAEHEENIRFGLDGIL